MLLEVRGSRVKGQGWHRFPLPFIQPLGSAGDNSRATPGKFRGNRWAGVRHGAGGSDFIIIHLHRQRRWLGITCWFKYYTKMIYTVKLWIKYNNQKMWVYCHKNKQNNLHNTHVEHQWTPCFLCRRSFCIAAFQSWNKTDQHQSSWYRPAAWCSYVFADFPKTGFAFCTPRSVSIWGDWSQLSYSLFSRIPSICSGSSLRWAWGKCRCREWPHRSPAGRESLLVRLLSRDHERTGHHGSLKKKKKKDTLLIHNFV